MKTYRIDELTQVISGGTPSTKNPNYWSNEVVWLTPKDLSNNNDKYIFNSQERISFDGLNHSSAKLLPKNAVLLSSRAPIGYLAIAGCPLATNQGFKSMICNEDLIHHEYLYYLLSTKVDELNNISTGSTFKELSASVLRQYKISIHNMNVQQHIVDTRRINV